MSAVVSIEPATLAHADHIAGNMRKSDVLEVRASHGHDPFQAARGSVLASRFAFCGLVDSRPVYLFGMRDGTAVDSTGYVWGLGTDEVSSYSKSFWPASRNFVSFCRGHVVHLGNFVHVDNHMSIAWLRRLGFMFDDPAPFGVEGREFMRFWMKGGFLNV